MASAGPRDVALSSRERIGIFALYLAIAVTTIAAFLASFAYLPHNLSGQVTGGGLIFTGLAVTAYFLGLRHGFDADHIAAIDNTTRKLLNDGQRPLTVGTWFSLGHSTIVAAMVAALVLVTDFIKTYYGAFASVGAVLGTLISGIFLFLIGLVNVVIVVEVYRMFRGLRDRTLDSRALDAQMEKRGLLYRYFGRLFRIVRRPRDIFPIGVLFGLGFDTATEVLLISIAVAFAVTSTIPLWAVMILPLLFTCGMVLSDTTDGIAMRYAYGWAFTRPIRKIYYNLTLTIVSVLVAFAIGGIELLQVLAMEFGWKGQFWSGVASLDFSTLGIVLVVMFVGTWLIALLIYRVKRYEEIGFDASPPDTPIVGGPRPPAPL